MKRLLKLIALGALIAVPLAGQDFEIIPDAAALISKSDAVGVLRVLTAWESYTCSAFAVAPHYWVSAGHCAPESPELRAAQRSGDTILIKPIQRRSSIPTPADTSQAPLKIDGYAARFVKANDKFALFYRIEPTLDYFAMASSAPAGARAWLYPTRSHATFSGTEDVAKIPLETLISANDYLGYELVVGIQSMPGFSGAPVIIRAGDQYLAVGLVDAMEVALYVVHYIELPVVGTAESPYSLAYGLDSAEIESWIAEDSIRFEGGEP